MDKQQLLQIKIAGVGDPQSGFVKGKYGPFKCGACEWMDKDEGQCTNPAVNSSTALTDRTKDGLVKVDADDCSNHFWPIGLDPAEYAKDEKLDTRSPHGFPPLSPEAVTMTRGRKKKK